MKSRPVLWSQRLTHIIYIGLKLILSCSVCMLKINYRSRYKVYPESEMYLHINKFSPGRSENSRMHSLKPFARRRSLSCCRMATPMQKGNEELPKSSVSHRWKILCSGNTSREIWTNLCYFKVEEAAWKCVEVDVVEKWQQEHTDTFLDTYRFFLFSTYKMRWSYSRFKNGGFLFQVGCNRKENHKIYC